MTLTKNGGVKTLTNKDLIKQCLADGWTEQKEVKEASKPKAKTLSE